MTEIAKKAKKVALAVAGALTLGVAATLGSGVASANPGMLPVPVPGVTVWQDQPTPGVQPGPRPAPNQPGAAPNPQRPVQSVLIWKNSQAECEGATLATAQDLKARGYTIVPRPQYLPPPCSFSYPNAFINSVYYQ